MADEYLKYIILLEDALADFYKKIIKYPGMERIKAILEFMETHSSAHAEKVRSAQKRHIRPSLDSNIILNRHNALTNDVARKIESEKDLSSLLQTLADSEEDLGKLYEEIVSFFKEMSEYYRALSDEVQELANDEYNHRDLLLKDKSKYIK